MAPVNPKYPWADWDYNETESSSEESLDPAIVLNLKIICIVKCSIQQKNQSSEN